MAQEPYSSDFIYEHLQQEYDREIERLNRFRERLGFVCGFCLLLGGGVTSLISSYTLAFESHFWRDLVFAVSLATSAAFFIPSIIHLGQCTLPKFKFANVDSGLVYLESYKTWKAYAAKLPESSKPDVDGLFRDKLCETFAKAASHNRKLTEEKNDRLYQATRSAFHAALVLIIPAICVVAKQYDPEVPAQIQIKDPIQTKLLP
ncbi:MAG TPA: hypothetical protein VG734_14515 [Lacunisphaera sp.]|nr:hypothetical protein [Lacunisphaera sp.]